MTRKIIQIAASASSAETGRRDTLYALDEDGKTWLLEPYGDSMIWSELPDLPPKPKRTSMLDAL